MCGRFSLTKQEADIESRFNARFYSNDLVRRYNVAPSQLALVMTSEKPEELQLFKWGLVPSWSKDPAIGNRMINAKSETVFEKPSFKNLIRRKRCLVVSDGFYEWKTINSKTKIPYRFCLKNEDLFTFAGIWDSWPDKQTGEILNSFSILTTDANQLVEPIHDRMPVIIKREDENKYLDENLDETTLKQMFLPFPPEEMKAYPVSPLLNSPKNDTAELLLPFIDPST